MDNNQEAKAAEVLTGKALAIEIARENTVNAEDIAKWKAQYGVVYKIEAENEEDPLILYFRKPSRQHLSRFTKALSKDALNALQNLVADTLIFPAMESLKPLLQEKPGLIIPIGTKLQEIVGTNTDFLAQEL